MFETNPDIVRISAEPISMWNGGPTRRWAAVRCPEATMPTEYGGYVGNYVCQGCMEPTVGVYRVKRMSEVARIWVCAACRSPGKAKL